MVIGHFIGSVINLGAAKVIPKGSKIEVAKAVKMAQGISGHGGSRGAPIERAPIEPRGVITSKGTGKGTGSRGGNTKNDKTIDKKLNEKKKKVKKINKSDKKRVLQGKLPVVPRKTHYKKQSKDTPLVVKGSGVKATEYSNFKNYGGVKATELKRSKLKPEQHDAHVKSYYNQHYISTPTKEDPTRQVAGKPWWRGYKPKSDFEKKIKQKVLSDEITPIEARKQIERQSWGKYSSDLPETERLPIPSFSNLREGADGRITLGSSAIEIKWWKKYKPKSAYAKKIKQQVISGEIDSDEGHRAIKEHRKNYLAKGDMTFRLEELAEDTGLVPRSRVENKYFKGDKKGSSLFEIWQKQKESAPKGSDHQKGNRGATFWKKTADGRSTFRDPMQRGEQTIKKKNALKWVAFGSAGTFGAATLGSKKDRKNDRWGYW